MPVVIDRDTNKTTRPASRVTRQQTTTNRKLIYSSIVVIIVCWCLVAFQMFGGSIGHSAAVSPTVSAPAGIKLTLPKAP